MVYPERDDGATGAHDVTVAGAANPCVQGVAALGYGDFFLESFTYAHGIYGVGGFVRGEADDALDALFYGGVKDVVSADHVGLDGFHGEEFATGDLLEGCGVEDVIYSMYCGLQRGFVADVAYVKLNLVCHVRVGSLVFVAHVILFFLVA